MRLSMFSKRANSRILNSNMIWIRNTSLFLSKQSHAWNVQSCRCPGRDKRRNESDWAMLVFFGRAVSNNCVRRGKMLEGKPFWYFTVRRWTIEMEVFISSLILRFYVIYTLKMDANEKDNGDLVNWLCFFTWTSDIKLWNHALSMLNSPLPNWTWLSKCF